MAERDHNLGVENSPAQIELRTNIFPWPISARRPSLADRRPRCSRADEVDPESRGGGETS